MEGQYARGLDAGHSLSFYELLWLHAWFGEMFDVLLSTAQAVAHVTLRSRVALDAARQWGSKRRLPVGQPIEISVPPGGTAFIELTPRLAGQKGSHAKILRDDLPCHQTGGGCIDVGRAVNGITKLRTRRPVISPGTRNGPVTALRPARTSLGTPDK